VVALLAPAVAFGLPALSANPANNLLARGIDPMRYDPATHCTGKETPGIRALGAWLQHNAAGISWGTYRCEMWGKHEASLHAEGRAIDWHLDASIPSERKAAYALIRLLLAPDRAGNPVALARRMGIQGLIFDCKQWYGDPDGTLGDYSYCFGPNGKRKKVDPTQAHMNHIHIELNKLGARMRTTFWDRTITYPIEPLQPQPAPQPEPQPQPDPTMPAAAGGGTWDASAGGASYPGYGPR
jgi:hypothetical protein